MFLLAPCIWVPAFCATRVNHHYYSYLRSLLSECDLYSCRIRFPASVTFSVLLCCDTSSGCSVLLMHHMYFSIFLFISSSLNGPSESKRLQRGTPSVSYEYVCSGFFSRFSSQPISFFTPALYFMIYYTTCIFVNASRLPFQQAEASNATSARFRVCFIHRWRISSLCTIHSIAWRQHYI